MSQPVKILQSHREAPLPPPVALPDTPQTGQFFTCEPPFKRVVAPYNDAYVYFKAGTSSHYTQTTPSSTPPSPIDEITLLKKVSIGVKTICEMYPGTSIGTISPYSIVIGKDDVNNILLPVMVNKALNEQAGGVESTRWSSPESLRCAEYGLPSHVFNLGMMLYSTIIQDVPYAHITAHNVAGSIIAGVPVSLDALTESHREFISRCISIDPRSRPSIDEVIEFFTNEEKGVVE